MTKRATPDLGSAAALDSQPLPAEDRRIISGSNDGSNIVGFSRNPRQTVKQSLQSLSKISKYHDIEMMFAIPDAAFLYDFVMAGDDASASAMLKSSEFGLPVIKALIDLLESSEDERKAKLAKSESDLRAELDAKLRQRKAQTEKAIQTRRDESLILKIMKWFENQEKSGINLMGRDISGKISEQFNVTPSYARKLRSQYFK